MKKSFYKSFLLLLFFVTCISSLTFAQVPSIFKSIASGTWKAAATTTWEKSVNGGVTFAPATAAPGSGSNVIVSAGTTVTIDAGVSCLNLTIEAGATLMNVAAGTNSIKLGVAAAGVAGSIDTLKVDGTFGGAGDLTAMEFGISSASLWVTGTGTIAIGRIRATNANLNFPGSATPGAANVATLIIDKDINFQTAANYAYSIPNSGQTATDTIAYNILAGRTVTVSSPTSYMHNNAVSAGAVSTTGGKYVYNVNGTLDLSANTSTTGGTSLIPFGNAAAPFSSITLNVGGLLKLGAYFKADTVANSAAGNALYMNINNGGQIDASLTTVLKTGIVNTAVGNLFFVTNGNGTLKRTVPTDGSNTVFPIGINLGSYTPVSISTTTGTAQTFTANVSSTFTNTPPAQTLPRQWNLTEGTASGNAYSLSFSWTTADEGASGFTHGGAIYIIHWNGASWDYTPATVTGTGVLSDPYVATASGFTAFSPYSVTSNTPTPVVFGSISAVPSSGTVKVAWNVASEVNTKQYVVERSSNGVQFSAIGTVNASGLSRYTLTDLAPINGNGFYRIKGVDVNGNVVYTIIVKVGSGNTAPELLIAPNPVQGKKLYLHLNNLAKGDYTINIFSTTSQKVFSNSISHPGGSSAQTFTLPSSLAKGIYNVHVSNGSTSYNKSILVQ